MTFSRRVIIGGGLAGLVIGPSAALGQAVEPLRPFTIPSGSMEPTLLVGDLVVTRWTGRPGAPALVRGDVIIFRREGRFWCKRLIGLPGDTIAMVNGTPRVNGVALARRNVQGVGRTSSNELLIETLGDRTYRIQVNDLMAKRYGVIAQARKVSERVVPEGHVFAMGDNRDDSQDSRAFGPVPIADLRFIAIQILLSSDPTRIGYRLDRNVH